MHAQVRQIENENERLLFESRDERVLALLYFLRPNKCISACCPYAFKFFNFSQKVKFQVHLWKKYLHIAMVTLIFKAFVFSDSRPASLGRNYSHIITATNVSAKHDHFKLNRQTALTFRVYIFQKHIHNFQFNIFKMKQTFKCG